MESGRRGREVICKSQSVVRSHGSSVPPEGGGGSRNGMDVPLCASNVIIPGGCETKV